MKKNKQNQKNKTESKTSKKEQVLDWLKFLALVLIVLPPCTFIFEGFNPYGLIFVGLGVVLFIVNLFIAYSMQKKQEKTQEQSQCDKKPNNLKQQNKSKNKKHCKHK